MNQLEHRIFEQKSKEPWEKIVQHTQLTSTQLTLILPRKKNKKKKSNKVIFAWDGEHSNLSKDSEEKAHIQSCISKLLWT